KDSLIGETILGRKIVERGEGIVKVFYVDFAGKLSEKVDVLFTRRSQVKDVELSIFSKLVVNNIESQRRMYARLALRWFILSLYFFRSPRAKPADHRSRLSRLRRRRPHFKPQRGLFLSFRALCFRIGSA